MPLALTLWLSATWNRGSYGAGILRVIRFLRLVLSRKQLYFSAAGLIHMVGEAVKSHLAEFSNGLGICPAYSDFQLGLRWNIYVLRPLELRAD